MLITDELGFSILISIHCSVYSVSPLFCNIWYWKNKFRYIFHVFSEWSICFIHIIPQLIYSCSHFNIICNISFQRIPNTCCIRGHVLGALGSKKGTIKYWEKYRSRTGMDHKMAERNFNWSSVEGGIGASEKIELGRAFKNWAGFALVERCGQGIPEARNTTAWNHKDVAKMAVGLWEGIE